MPDSALPKHLQGRKHEDWIFPLSLVPRGWTAFKFFQPPKMLLGYGVKRWDMASDRNTLNNYPYGERFLLGFQSTTHGANAIQKILGQWKFSFHITFPLSFHFTIKLGKRSKPSEEDIKRGVLQGYDQTHFIYGRVGFRWDSFDSYYNLGCFIGMAYN